MSIEVINSDNDYALLGIKKLHPITEYENYEFEIDFKITISDKTRILEKFYSYYNSMIKHYIRKTFAIDEFIKIRKTQYDDEVIYDVKTLKDKKTIKYTISENTNNNTDFKSMKKTIKSSVEQILTKKEVDNIFKDLLKTSDVDIFNLCEEVSVYYAFVDPEVRISIEENDDKTILKIEIEKLNKSKYVRDLIFKKHLSVFGIFVEFD